MTFPFKAILFTAILVFSAVETHAQSAGFSKSADMRFGGNFDDIISGLEADQVGNLYLYGTTYSSATGDITQPNYDSTLITGDFWLVKTDSLGNKIWDIRYGGSDEEYFADLVPLSSGDYLIIGDSYSNPGGDKSEPNWDPTLMSGDYWMARIDSAGNKLWDKRYGSPSFDQLSSGDVSSTGHIYLVGSSFNGLGGDKTDPNVGGWDMWIVRSDSNGTKIWDRTFGGLLQDYAMSCFATADGGVIVGGYSNSDISGDKSEACRGGFDYWIIKIDSLGNKVWDKTIGGNYVDYIFSICPSHEGGIIAGGQSFSPVSGDKTDANMDTTLAGSDYWVVKLSASGQKLWDKTYGGTSVEQLNRVVQASDSTYILSGESYSEPGGEKTEFNLGVEQTWVLKINGSGSVLWDKTIFSNGHDELGTAIEVSPLCFTAVNYTAADTGGYKSQMSRGAGDYWMIRICKDDPSVVPNHQSTGAFTLFPNPAGNWINIRIDQASAMFDYAVISDVLGRPVRKIALTESETHSEFTINLDGISSGYYILTLRGNGFAKASLPFIVK